MWNNEKFEKSKKFIYDNTISLRKNDQNLEISYEDRSISLLLSERFLSWTIDDTLKEIDFSTFKINKKAYAILITYINLIKKNINNLKTGVIAYLSYEYNTFDISIEQTDKEIKISNYLGSKKPIIIKKEENVETSFQGLNIILKGYDIQKIGILISRLTNLRRKSGFATKLDKRKFFDNYYRVNSL